MDDNGRSSALEMVRGSDRCSEVGRRKTVSRFGIRKPVIRKLAHLEILGTDNFDLVRVVTTGPLPLPQY